VEPPRRDVVQAEALEYLRTHPAEPGTSVVTSLPDLSETPELDLDGWKLWFVDAARQVLRWVPADGVAIFYQSDIRLRGSWIDKGYLVLRAAELDAATLVWHRIVCRKPPGTPSLGRPSYSHLICISQSPRTPERHPVPDVLPDAGFMPWSRAMGVDACRLACAYLIDETATSRVVDPFCGKGTLLAVANSMGLSALGVDRSARRCQAARNLTVEPDAEVGVRRWRAAAF
jgi:hypothetical protein